MEFHRQIDLVFNPVLSVDILMNVLDGYGSDNGFIGLERSAVVKLFSHQAHGQGVYGKVFPDWDEASRTVKRHDGRPIEWRTRGDRITGVWGWEKVIEINSQSFWKLDRKRWEAFSDKFSVNHLQALT
jgi:hypothetical protein